MLQHKPLRAPGFGDPLPFFAAETDGVARYSIDVAAGRWIVLMIFATLSSPESRAAHALVGANSDMFDDANAAFFGVSNDPDDRFQRGLANVVPGRRYFWDFDRAVTPLFGGTPSVLLIDRSFRIVMTRALADTAEVLERLAQELAAEPPVDAGLTAPTLTLPRVLEPELCGALIDYFKENEPEVSGFAATAEGRTVTVVNNLYKRRLDVTITDPALIETLTQAMRSRLFPMVQRAFGWQATAIERFLICRYGEDDQGFFSAHRDDATPGTAHRKFAVTINLNAGEYKGGDLRFPEFGRRLYAPPTGGATVFCCSLLHEVTPVTAGERFAFVPFLYDEDGRRIRRQNLASVGAEPTNRQARRAERGRR